MLQDCEPSLNSGKDRFGAQKFTIPKFTYYSRPEPYRKYFSCCKAEVASRSLDQQITQEDFPDFSARGKTTLKTIPIDEVDIIIVSMGKRINEITKQKGQRIKY